MRTFRGILALAGILMGLWGLWVMRDFRVDQLESAGIWLAAGLLVHDGIIAPLVVAYGALHVWAIPAYARRPATIGLILWGTVTVALANVLSGKGGKPDNDTVLDRPYLRTWLALSLILAVVIGLDIVWRRHRLRRSALSS